MVFMKGTRDAPRCGFSRTLVQILNGTGYVYFIFNFNVLQIDYNLLKQLNIKKID